MSKQKQEEVSMREAFEARQLTFASMMQTHAPELPMEEVAGHVRGCVDASIEGAEMLWTELEQRRAREVAPVIDEPDEFTVSTTAVDERQGDDEILDRAVSQAKPEKPKGAKAKS